MDNDAHFMIQMLLLPVTPEVSWQSADRVDIADHANRVKLFNKFEWVDVNMRFQRFCEGCPIGIATASEASSNSFQDIC